LKNGVWFEEFVGYEFTHAYHVLMSDILSAEFGHENGELVE
jgi:hypothetical protein